jgi:alpha-tubulin suppressor-like RCC1 family protein
MGQCGTGQTGERLLKANQVSFGTVTTLQRIRALESQTIAQIACGANHTMAMTADGNVYTWGFGAYGRLGQKDNKDILIPKIVETFQPERMRVALIAAGNSVSYFVQKLGNMLYMAGITKKSSEANMTPKPFYDLQGWVPRQIASGSTCTAVLAGTDLITWGPSPTYGELAYGELTKSSTRAKLVDDLHEVTVLSLACGAFATLCIVDPSSAVHVQKLQALKVYEPPAEPAAPAADSKKRAAPEAEKAGKKTKAAAKK